MEAGGDTCGYDAGKKVSGRKRHLVVDVDGSPLVAHVHPADVQDRDGAVPLLMHLQARQGEVRTVFADGGYDGPKLREALQKAGCSITVTVVKKPEDCKEFVLLPRRWVVERTFGWLRYTRRLSRDFERSLASALAWLQWSLIRVLMRRLGCSQVTVDS